MPIGYSGRLTDVAHLIALLASQIAHDITGAVIGVDGGMHDFAH